MSVQEQEPIEGRVIPHMKSAKSSINNLSVVPVDEIDCPLPLATNRHVTSSQSDPGRLWRRKH